MIDENRQAARRIVADAFHQDGSSSYNLVLAGGRDHDEAVQMAEAGFIAGRQFTAVAKPAWRTSDEQLDRMDALVKRLAQLRTNQPPHSRCSSAGPDSLVFVNVSDLIEAEAIIAAREPVDPRFDKVLGVLQQNERWLMPEDAARRFVRDVLVALDA